MANVRIIGLKNLGARFSAYQKHVRAGARRITIDELFKIDTLAKNRAPRKTTALAADIHVEPAADGLSGAVVSGQRIDYARFQHHGTMSVGAASAPRGVPSSAYSSRPGGIRATIYLLDSFDDRAPIYQSRLAANATSFR